MTEAASELALTTIHPGYLAYVPGGGLYATAVASYVADALNRFTGLAGAAPGLARLEHDVLSWLLRQPDSRCVVCRGTRRVRDSTRRFPGTAARLSSSNQERPRRSPIASTEQRF